MPNGAFEKPPIESAGRRKEAREDGEMALKSFIEAAAVKLKKEGIPVAGDLRIDVSAFREVYPDAVLERDEREVGQLRKKWYGKMVQQMESGGEDLERLTAAIFQKNFGPEFIVVRSSYYDDVKGGVDNLVLERGTGNLICALDEVGALSGPRYEEKKNKILARNIRENGASLKYGFTIERKRGRGSEFKLGRVDNLPIFYIALPESYIQQGIQNFGRSLTENSPYERKLFAYFIALMNAQVKELKLARQPLHTRLRERLYAFERTLKRFI